MQYLVRNNTPRLRLRRSDQKVDDSTNRQRSARFQMSPGLAATRLFRGASGPDYLLFPFDTIIHATHTETSRIEYDT